MQNTRRYVMAFSALLLMSVDDARADIIGTSVGGNCPENQLLSSQQSYPGQTTGTPSTSEESTCSKYLSLDKATFTQECEDCGGTPVIQETSYTATNNNNNTYTVSCSAYAECNP